MRILYFHQYFSTPRGSGSIRSYEMARALVERGHQVTMVCGASNKHDAGLDGKPMVKSVRRGDVDGIQVVQLCLNYSNYDSLLKRSITFLRFAMKSVTLARRFDYDLLVATSTPLTAGIPGIVMRRLKPGKPFVFEVRDLWPELPRAMGVIKNPVTLGVMSLLEWCSYRSARGCIGLSPGIVKGIERRLGKQPKPVAMIPNGCDLELFKPSAEARPGGTARPTALRAVFTGAHGIANGLDAVLDAAAVLKERGRSDIQFVFIGDGKLKPRLMARADREKLTNCVFLDPIPKLQLAEKIKEFDVGLMILDDVPAFYYGTSPNKFFDYIASGLPVINNYPGWLAELITEHQCGLTVPPRKSEAFADAMEQIADLSPEQRQIMGANARGLAESKFSRSQLSAQFCTFLEHVNGTPIP